MNQRTGELLDGKYELKHLIGEGGMGSVYEANHKLIGRRLAVKFLHPQYASNMEVVTRFQREAQAAAQIGHENIIEVTDMGTTEDGSPYIVMEYLEGFDLKKIIEDEGAQSPKRTAHIMVQALSALQAAHDVKIIYRDLKPENIYLIEKRGNPDYVKLLDFGISKFRALETDGAKGLTQTGTVLGTPHYMSPEQARGEQDLTIQSDIYAMGIILYQMLTGQLPFDAPNYNALLLKILTEDPPLPEDLNPDLPDELVSTIKRAMDRDPSVRFDSCNDFRNHLLQFAPGSSELSSQLSKNSRTAIRRALYQTKTPFEMSQSGIEEKTSKLPLILGGAATAVAATVLAVVFTTGDDKNSKPVTTPTAKTLAPVEKKSEPPKTPSTNIDNKPVSNSIKINISSTPATSKIKIDGVEVGSNPFTGSFIKGASLRTIEIFSPGYKTHKELIKFNKDLTLVYELEKVEKKRHSSKRRSKHKSKKEVKVQPKKTSPKVKIEKKPKKKPTRKIDYNDPWKS